MNVTEHKKLYHIVDKNESIEDICKYYMVEREQLLKLNNISSIYANQALLIPKSYSVCYVVQPLDNAEKIAKKLNISIETLLKNIKTEKFFIGQKIFLYFD